jgi:hypothetical protein
MKIFFGKWENQQRLISDYEITEKDLDGYEILFAAYGGRDYEGKALVILRKENKLYMTEGSHCSCFGLEGQFSPDEVNLEMLNKYKFNHYDEYEPDEVIGWQEFLERLNKE